MSDPKRLVDEGDGGLGGTLLASARADGPSRRSRERAAVALGLAVSAAAITSGSAATATAAVGAAATGVSGGVGLGGGAAKVAASGIWLKVIAGTLVTVAVAGGGVVAVQKASSSPPTTAATTVATTAHAAHAPTATTTTTTTTTAEPEPAPPSVAATALPTPSAKARAPHTSSSPASSDPTAAESSLARELRAVDTARSALDRGDPNAAIVALDEYDRTYPRGSLKTEANVARVDALLARGDKAAAKKLARDVLARDPSGPHARRLQKIAETAP